ncbi:hypothetical protein ACFLYQ_04320 [Chloroflexota bacterium]
MKNERLINFYFYLHLVDSSLPHPCPSPARTIENERNVFLAGEGCIRERGRSPLSKSLPLSNRQIITLLSKELFEMGIKACPSYTCPPYKALAGERELLFQP